MQSPPLRRGLTLVDWVGSTSGSRIEGQPKAEYLLPSGPLASFSHRADWRSVIRRFRCRQDGGLRLRLTSLTGSRARCGRTGRPRRSPATPTWRRRFSSVCDCSVEYHLVQRSSRGAERTAAPSRPSLRSALGQWSKLLRLPSPTETSCKRGGVTQKGNSHVVSNNRFGHCSGPHWHRVCLD